MYKKLTFLLLIFGLISTTAWAQEEQLANRYYETGEYEKALDIYLDLYKKNNSAFFYQRITESYIQLGNEKEAISFIKKDFKKNSGNELRNRIDLIYLYKRLEDEKSYQKEGETLLAMIKSSPSRVHSANKMLSQKGLFDWSLAAIIEAEKHPGMRLTYQKAQVYAELGRLNDMYETYIAMVEESPGYLSTVKSLLSRSLSKDSDDEYNQFLKERLIKRLQKIPNEYLTDVLIHVFMHEENYAGALRQAIAQDKRNNGDQGSVFRLGQVALEKGDFQTAYQAWDFIIERKPPSSYKNAAIVERFRTTKMELDSRDGDREGEYVELAKNIRGFINEKDWSYPGVELAQILAEIQAFELGDLTSATKNLKRMDESGRLPQSIRVNGKLLLGDIHLFAGKYTEALLAYAQAEKLAGDQPIGDEAKFRMGKVAYFQADFSYALNTFDVLKASTSKHTANDAMRLSLLIRENTMLDTNYQAMTFFAQADLLHYRKKYDAAIRQLQFLRDEFPRHTLQDEILLKMGKIYIDQNKFEDAARVLDKLITEHPSGILLDEGLMLIADIMHKHLDQPEKAKDYYERLITELPNSYFISEARKHYRQLRGDINF
ncbi:MAG: tetratricopeptide repeat protein [Cryomorphaceae bacterium]|nr:tetratricopeptide repeat protein [Cryomorphaceae bacterium]